MVRYGDFSDNELAVLMKTGDHHAFTEIYRRYWKQIFIVAARRLGDEDAEEIIQIIFLNLWNKRKQFNLVRPFRHYFAVAAKYEIIGFFRKAEIVSSYKQHLKSTFIENSEDTLHLLDYNELENKLAIVVNDLPEKCRLVFKLKYEDGLSQKQIANQLSISEKAVEGHLSRARKVVKKHFGVLYFLIVTGFQI